MKLATTDREIERIGISSETAFSVKSTGKAFRILSSGLYKDKVLAIVRELSCNAFDAHVAAGKADVPFYVHLPNPMEPFFAIRDYGIGLSHEDMITVYSTYFESTKTASNDYIGALGLGSKSPFSYVDSFTVTSFYNGEKSSYACYINEYDCPVVTRMGVEQTRESNGLEVRIPVEKAADFADFVRAGQRVYRLFSPLPNIVGAAEFKIEERRIVLERPGSWRIFAPSSRYSERDGAVAVMGKIAYPINGNSLVSRLSPDATTVLSLRIEIDFAIGDLEFTAGREDLSYDQKITIPNLVKRLDEVHKDIRASLNEYLSSAKNIFAAHRLFGDFQDLGFYENSALLRGLKWNGKPVASRFATVLGTDLPDGADLLVLNSRESTANMARAIVTTQQPKENEQKVLQYTIACSSKMRFFKFDKGTKSVRGVRSRLSAYMREVGSSQMPCAILIEGTPEHFAAFEASFPGIVMEDVLSLPETNTKPRTKTSCRSLTAGSSLGYASKAEIDVEDGGMYVLTSNGIPTDPATKTTIMSTAEFDRKFKLLTDAGIINKKVEIIVVPVSVSSKIVASEEWVSAIEWMQEEAKKFVEDPANCEAIPFVSEMDAFKASFRDTYGIERLIQSYKNIGTRLHQDHPIPRLARDYEEVQKEIAKVRLVSQIISAFNLVAPTTAGTKKKSLVDTHKLIQKRYPLLSGLDWRFTAPGYPEFDSGHAANYIKMVDQALMNIADAKSTA